MRVFADDFRTVVESLVNTSDNNYHVTCRTGASGRWAYTPYCAILSSPYNYSVTGFTPSRGIFPSYLLSVESSEIYLAYMIGVGTKTERNLKKIVSEVRFTYTIEGFCDKTEEMNLGKDIHNYALATIWFKKYTASDLPSNDILEEDLLRLIKFHESNGVKINKIADDVMQSRL